MQQGHKNSRDLACFSVSPTGVEPVTFGSGEEDKSYRKSAETLAAFAVPQTGRRSLRPAGSVLDVLAGYPRPGRTKRPARGQPPAELAGTFPDDPRHQERGRNDGQYQEGQEGFRDWRTLHIPRRRDPAAPIE